MMMTANLYKGRPRTAGSRGRKGLWILALVGVSMAAVMALMIAASDQIPYGATQVWSAEPAGGVHTVTTSGIGSHVIGGNAYGQDTGSLPAATLIHVGAR